jgi:hypothetical protein
MLWPNMWPPSLVPWVVVCTTSLFAFVLLRGNTGFVDDTDSAVVSAFAVGSLLVLAL